MVFQAEFIFFRALARRCLLVFSFVVRLYLHEDSVYEAVKAELRDAELSLDMLHRYFYDGYEGN